MKTLHLLIAAGVTLGGCSTTIGEMRTDTPRASYVSARSEPALESCVAGSIRGAGQPAIVHGERATEIAYDAGVGSPFLVITLRPAGGHTVVEVREKLGYVGRFRRAVEACVNAD